jgi:ABC-2 type transport system ATP-binding protein
MIRASDLCRSFGGRVAVDRLTFEIADGEIVGLLGPNGAGKTTTLRMIAGIIAPSSGHAEVNGIDPAAEPVRVHETIGFLTESPGFYERMSAERNLSYFARFYPNLDVRGSVRRALDLVGLMDRAGDRVATFSKGMKQRLALARTLVHEPKTLLLDEPTAGLDPEAAKELRALIRRFGSEGRTILLSTHNLTEAENLSSRIAVLRTRLVALDRPEALRVRRESPAVRVRAGRWPDGAIERIAAEPFVLDVLKSPDGVARFRLADEARDRPALVARLVGEGVEILEVVEETRTLEDVYLELVREEEA